MRECYHAECDSVRNGHTADFVNMDFYVQTIKTLVDMTLEKTSATCKGYKKVKVSPKVTTKVTNRPEDEDAEDDATERPRVTTDSYPGLEYPRRKKVNLNLNNEDALNPIPIINSNDLVKTGVNKNDKNVPSSSSEFRPLALSLAMFLISLTLAIFWL